jgi:hypothetical protein
MAGKKTFVAGEVLTAQDVNDYLMDQSVMNFASDAARSSAIPTPTEGMFAVTTDNDQVDYYNGSDWVPALPIGAWTAYTPTITAATGTITSTTITRAKYAKLGKIVHLNIDFTITNNGTGAGSVYITLPSGVNASAAFYHGVGRENTASGAICNFFTLNTTQIRMNLGSGGYPGGTGYNLSGSITYETA